MKVQQLYDLFRAEMVDIATPYLWGDDEVFAYMDDAYKMFVRLTGGIADFTSEATLVDIVTGEAVADLDRRILRIMQAFRVSDGAPIQIKNPTDIVTTRDNDYGMIRPVYLDTRPGPVRYMVIGAQRGKCKWIQVPEVDDQAQLYIYRLPLVSIDPDDPDLDFEFDEIGEEHHPHLVNWMRRCAYLKSDVDTFDKGKADDHEARFRAYCGQAKDEWERYKHKHREVVYGGL